MYGEIDTHGVLNERFNTPARFGVLLVCEGAPESTSLLSVWRFLSRKLMNPRFYDFLPAWLWQPLAYAVVLPCIVREQQKMYQNMWVRRRPRIGAADEEDIQNLIPAPEGCEMEEVNAPSVVVLAEELGRRLEEWMRQKLIGRTHMSVQVEVGFYHREGSVEAALERLQLRGCYGRNARDSAGEPIVVEVESLIVLPLYPQHKAEFTGTVWDAVMRNPYFQRHHNIPNVHFIRNYTYHEVYLDTWHRHIRRYIGQHGTPDWLFIVFQKSHKYDESSGDTYRDEYTITAEQLRERLSTSWPTLSSMTPLEEGPFYRGSLEPSRITTAFFGRGSDTLKEPRLEKVFLSIIRQLKSISVATSASCTSLTSSLNREGNNSDTTFDNSRMSSAPHRSRTPLPLDMAPTAFVVCPGEALDDTTALWKLRVSLFPVVKMLGWKDVQYIPALNDTVQHAEMLSAVLQPYLF